jgi:hypothetical protein
MSARVIVDSRRVIVQGRITREKADSIRSNLARQWQALRIGPSQRPVVMVVSVDSGQVETSSTPDQHEDAGWDVAFAPRNGPVEPCLAVVRAVERRPTRYPQQTLDDPELYQASGLCAFYAAFGNPGPAIQRWLSEREYDVAREADWGDTLDLNQANPSNIDVAVVHPLRGGWIDASGALATINSAFLRCSDRNYADCERLVLDRELRMTEQPRTSRTSGRRTQSDSTTTWILTQNWSSVIIDQLLSAMVRSEGRERFARFWQSDQPPAIAFQQATGTPLGQWVHSWIRNTLGQTRRGTHVTPLPVLLAILFLTGGFAAAAYAAARRSAG